MTPDDPIEINPPPVPEPSGAEVSAQTAREPTTDSAAVSSDGAAAADSPALVKTTAKPADAKSDSAKPPVKPATVKAPAPPPAPFVPHPSMPISMINSPERDANAARPADGRFSGELEEDFETALAAVKMAPRKRSLAAMLICSIAMLMGRSRAAAYERVRRAVAFDGFRTNLHDEKLERDRRYGTVYNVTEELNAYLVRLEMPRRMPNSSLRRTWNLPEEMPDYDYSLSLRDGVLAIRASVPGEARRRLSYVSPSFPADFLTRMEFARPVGGFSHRLRDKVLEIIVFKRDETFRSAA
ncbi:MAG TPA: hypothetical protein VJ718_10575 [Candidatus Binataceae bacterium]|nr:hypothetical protein [Candidatus Binataceae bacterium]